MPKSLIHEDGPEVSDRMLMAFKSEALQFFSRG